MNADPSATIRAFFDVRSPYSFLALSPARELAERYGVFIDWWPFITDFRSAYGGEVEERSARDIAKLKYLYMDARRLALRQGVTIRSTTKLWNAELASQALLFAKSKDRFWEFAIPMLTAFWRREFDLESSAAIENAVVGAGLHQDEWRSYLKQGAAKDLTRALDTAESLGVFGAPTFIYEDEIFWGGDRLYLLEEALSMHLNQPSLR